MVNVKVLDVVNGRKEAAENPDYQSLNGYADGISERPGPGIDGVDSANGSKSQDCHSTVISSGTGAKGTACCNHRSHQRNRKVHVACQTDPEVYYFTGSNTRRENFPGTTQMRAEFQQIRTPLPPQITAVKLVDGQSPETSTKKPVQTTPKKEDGSKSEGTLRLMVNNFWNMNTTIRGPPKSISGVPWKIMVMPRQHVVAKKGTQKCLGFFLQCCPDSYSDSWQCTAAAELRLISQKPEIPNFVRKTNHTYTAKENDWGYSCFMTWADILDESQGYMKDDRVILEVHVKAESPKNILTHEAFCKKIQNYMRLSDLQSSRGLIDKALEVNQTALKFCKEKDPTMKEELEAQKAILIEKKLKQSIERIEKGSKFGDGNEKDSAGTESGGPKQSGGSLTGKLQSGVNGKSAFVATGKKTIRTPKLGSPEKDVVESPEGKVNSHEEAGLVNGTGTPEEDGPIADFERNGELGEKKAVSRLVSDLVSQVSGVDGSGSAEAEEDALCDSCLVEKLEKLRLTQEDTQHSPAPKADFAMQTDFPDDTPVLFSPRKFATPAKGSLSLPPHLKSKDNSTTPVTPPQGKRNIVSARKSIHGNAVARKLENELRQATQVTQTAEEKVSEPKAKKAVNSAPPTPDSKQLCKDGSNVDVPTRNKLFPPLFPSAAAALQEKLKQHPLPKTPADSEELLRIITEESKQSLGSIKETIERLVNLAGAGDGATLNGPKVAMDDLKSMLADVVDMKVSGEKLDTSLGNKRKPPAQNEHKSSPLKPQPTKQPERDSSKTATAHGPIGGRDPPEPGSGQFLVGGKNESTIKDDLLQKVVQTDLSYHPRSNSPSLPAALASEEDELALLQQAREMMESQADEWAAKYGQLLEQSEATRLADTVKKVEKRMKDIEKQTMTCRKELSDECERHYKEEQKLIKANKQLKQQMDAQTEKIDKLSGQLKEKRNEVKKLEKRLKNESQSTAEHDELLTKLEKAEKDLSSIQRRHSDEVKRLNKEVQKLSENSEQLQEELSGAETEIERLNGQLSEKTSAMKKLESSLKSEKNQTHQGLKEAVERAKKAEGNLLEFKLEMGLRICHRAMKECDYNISQAEELCNKLRKGGGPTESLKAWSQYYDDWCKNRDKLRAVISNAKSEYGHQIEMVRSGKSLASLPILECPSPPTPPVAPKYPSLPAQNSGLLQHHSPQPGVLGSLSQAQYPGGVELVKRLAPIGVNPLTGGTGNRSPPQHVSQPPQQQQGGSEAEQQSYAKELSLSNVQNESQSSQQISTAHFAPFGDNSGNEPSSTIASQQQAQQQQQLSLEVPPTGWGATPLPAVEAAFSGGAVSAQGPSANVSASQLPGVNGVTSSTQLSFSPWTDTFPNVQQTLYGNSVLDGLSGFDLGTLGPLNREQSRLPQPTQPFQISSNVGIVGNESLRQQQQQRLPPQQTWSGPQSSYAGWGTAQPTFERPGSATGKRTSPANVGGSMEPSGTSSPQANMQPRNTMILENLMNNFPSIPHETIKRHFNDYRANLTSISYRMLTPAQVINAVSTNIRKAQQEVNRMSDGYGAAFGSMQEHNSSGSLDGSPGICAICRDSLKSRQESSEKLNCNHQFHAQCLKGRIGGGSAADPRCPICGTYFTPLKDFPELGK